MDLVIRKEADCLRNRQLRVLDGWDGRNEEVVFQPVGPQGGEQAPFAMTREDAADLGRALVSLYGEG